MSTKKLYLGIDPGWKHLGWAVVSDADEEGGLFHIEACGSEAPASAGVMYASTFASFLHHIVAPQTGDLRSATIERYVAYENKMSAETENILMTIGGLQTALLPWVRPEKGLGLGVLTMVRAIDWKIPLAQTLFKKLGFENPSDKLDKKFSVAAAKRLVDNSDLITDDHIADAVCLAAFPVFVKSIAKA